MGKPWGVAKAPGTRTGFWHEEKPLCEARWSFEKDFRCFQPADALQETLKSPDSSPRL